MAKDWIGIPEYNGEDAAWNFTPKVPTDLKDETGSILLELQVGDVFHMWPNDARDAWAYRIETA